MDTQLTGFLLFLLIIVGMTILFMKNYVTGLLCIASIITYHTSMYYLTKVN